MAGTLTPRSAVAGAVTAVLTCNTILQELLTARQKMTGRRLRGGVISKCWEQLVLSVKFARVSQQHPRKLLRGANDLKRRITNTVREVVTTREVSTSPQGGGVMTPNFRTTPPEFLS